MQTIKGRNEQMWRTSVTITIGVTLVSTIFACFTIATFPNQAAPIITLSLTGLFVSAALLASGTRTKPALSISSFFLITGGVLWCVWTNHKFLFQSHRVFELFAGDKIFALLIAIVAPPILWVGLTAIISTALIPTIQFFTIAPALRHGLPLQEPWITLAYGAIALVVYISRLKWYKAQLHTAQLEARAQLLQEFAHLLINAQHLTNTPLQTIENSVAIIRSQNPEQEKVIVVMGRALRRIREVMLLFSSCNSFINWSEMKLPGSVDEFEKRLKDLMTKVKAQG